MSLQPAAVLDRIRRAIGSPSGPVALHEPAFEGNEWTYVKECIDTGWVSSVGTYVDRFELELARVCNVERAVAVVNGTAALHVALQLCNVGAGDEVIVPTLTFVATANAVVYCGAVPHFADSDEVTFGIDAGKLERHLEETARLEAGVCINRQSGRRIAAIVPMHVFGHAVDMDALMAVGARFGLPIIEDAAEAVGSSYKNKPLGSLGRVGVLSFNGNKIITTGGGGALLFNDATLAARAKHLTTTGRVPHAWSFEHDAVAYNYRMPNLNAALGVAQLERLDAFVEAKRRLAASYAQAFEGLRHVRFFKEQPFARSNYWLNAIVLDEASTTARNPILAETNAAGIMTRPVWRLAHSLPMYCECPRMDLSTAESLELRIINLPSSAKLSHAPN